MRTDLFDFELPPASIALRPASPRDAARMLVVQPDGVLRDRKKLKAKIRALSQGAKSSAAIIGALPPAILIFMSMSSPDYISLLWTEDLGHLMLAGSAFWMFCGVMVMRQMMNFEI